MDIENVRLVGLGTLNHVPVQKGVLQASLYVKHPTRLNDSIGIVPSVETRLMVIIVDIEPREDSSQSPPQIDHQCCYGCDDLLDGVFCRRCTSWDRVSEIKNVVGNTQYKPKDVKELFHKLLNDVQNILEELDEYINIPSWNHPAFSNHDDDDEHYTSPITPEEPDNSLSMGDEHPDTIPATKSDEVIKSSVEDLIPIPKQFKEFSYSNDDSTSIDDNYFSIDNIDYIELSPPDFELVILEEVKDDNLLSFLISYPVEDIKSFLKKFDTSLSYSDNSLPEFETFSNHTEETNSGSTTTHADYSLPKYDSFLFEIEPDQGELTSVVILAEPRVYVPNVLTTHPTLMLDSDFIPSDNSLPEFEIFYLDIEEKNSGSTTIHADISFSISSVLILRESPIWVS
nr:hypothetical protein [Tanacetum cinerariifolium]